MNVIDPVAVTLLSTSVAESTLDEWDSEETYSLNDVVKVTDQPVHKTYISLRDNNTNRYPPQSLEPVQEVSTSTTSIAVETGTKTFTVETGKSFSAGMEVAISKITTPRTIHMNAEVISYNDGTGALEVSVYSVTGTGTHANWKIESNDEVGFWKEDGATNQYKMLDEYINTMTEDTGSITFRVPSNNIDRIALFNLYCSNIDVFLLDPNNFEISYQDTITNQRNFGRSCAISSDGTTLAVGKPYDRINGNNTGSVNIYVNLGGTWVLRDVVYTLNFELNSEFGTSCALNSDGSILFVGAHKATVEANAQAGEIHIFDYVEDAWVERGATLTADVPSANEQFGIACSCNADGTILAVGCGNNVTAMNGPVYVFEDDGGWTLRDTVTPANTENGDHFGLSVSLSADANYLVVGAPCQDREVTVEGFGLGRFGLGGFGDEQASTGLAPGRAYVFSWDVDAWDEDTYITSPYYVVYNNMFGESCAINADGSALVISSSLDNTLYLYELNSTWELTDEFTHSTMGQSCACSGDATTIFVGDTLQDSVHEFAFREVLLWHHNEDIIYGSPSVERIRDWYEYFFGVINVRTDANIAVNYSSSEAILEVVLNGATYESAVRLGNFVPGRSYDIGKSLYEATAEINDYSQKETDPETGVTTLVQGKFSKINEVDVFICNTQIDAIYKLLAGLRGRPTAWIADNDEFEMFMVYGYYSRFAINVSGVNHSFCSFEINGLI